jgi:CRISPR-associated endonuclease Cas2
MHYVICYDLESDRLRDRVVKVLQKHGCSRVQRSVFVAADLDGRHLQQLTAALTRLAGGGLFAEQDSLLVIPLSGESAQSSIAIGCANNILTAVLPLPLKVML